MKSNLNPSNDSEIKYEDRETNGHGFSNVISGKEYITRISG